MIAVFIILITDNRKSRQPLASLPTYAHQELSTNALDTSVFEGSPIPFEATFLIPVSSPTLMLSADLTTPQLPAINPTETLNPAYLALTPSPSAEETESDPGLALQPGYKLLSYSVKNGDSLYRIAQTFEIEIETITAANTLINPNRLQIGDVLQIIVPETFNPSPELNAHLVALNSDPDLGIMEIPATATPPEPNSLQGIPLDVLIVLPDAVKANIRQIFATGQRLGRNPRAFSKVGDSTIENPFFLSRFDDDPSTYNLGNYAYLKQIIDVYAGSFGRESIAVRRGLHSWSIFDPMWADRNFCQPNETVIVCEFRLQNPSLVFIKLGSNDVGVPEMFENNMRQLVQYAIDNGVIPVLGTKADRHEGSNENNIIIRRVAAEYQIPIWEFDLLSDTIPGKGLGPDAVHLTTFFAHDYTLAQALQSGHGAHNLITLMAIYRIWQTLNQAQ
ncbi:hypothetical protein MASR2M15_22660 [Anaerolineales bacterium]